MGKHIPETPTSSQEISPKELKEIQDYLFGKNIDIEINLQTQKVRPMKDGGMVIDPPQVMVRFVRLKQTNGKHKKIDAV